MTLNTISTAITFLLLIVFSNACRQKAESLLSKTSFALETKGDTVRPLIITEPAAHDTDDAAIWVNIEDLSKSLIIGTDKDSLGALYVYDLGGKIILERTVKGLTRPNNVDVEYGFDLNGKATDIVVVTERFTNMIRVFRMPDMKPLDDGGIQVFENERYRSPMGVAIYKRASDRAFFVIVGRKEGPAEGYLWQYQLNATKSGNIAAHLVRKFGAWSGKEEIESIAVDDKLGFVYYSDETHGIRKYFADSQMGDEELALFGTTGFAEDQEGISVYEQTDSTGYILVSDQQASRFHIFSREGTNGLPHDYTLIKTVQVAAKESDGSDVTNQSFNNEFPGGLFVVMSDDRTFHYYSWQSLMGDRNVE
ncbi:MAG: phytase [Cyclobacteriaceae bacterium]